MDELCARAEFFGVEGGTIVSGHEISSRRQSGESTGEQLEWACPAF
jgi:hypothetical protein